MLLALKSIQDSLRLSEELEKMNWHRIGNIQFDRYNACYR